MHWLSKREKEVYLNLLERDHVSKTNRNATTVYRLRKKLIKAKSQFYIVTVHNKGYRIGYRRKVRHARPRKFNPLGSKEL